MAGDWIKMRGNLWDDPRVAKLCDLTDCGEAQIIGKVSYWLWATGLTAHRKRDPCRGGAYRDVERGITEARQVCDIKGGRPRMSKACAS